MADWSQLDELPAEIARERTPDVVFAVRGDLAGALREAGYARDSGAAIAESDLAGRASMGEIVASGERFVVRRFHHGGLLRWLTGRRYRDPLRPFREWALSRRLAAAGVRTPEVVAAKAKRTLGGLWELELVSRRVEGAVDLGTLALRARDGRVGRSSALLAARAFGALVRRLHELGFLHADLTPRNVLVLVESLERASPELWVLDLDGSRFRPRLNAEERAANLARLARHVERMVREGQADGHARLAAAFLGAYEPERGARRALRAEVERMLARARTWHALGDQVERGAGGRRSVPRP